MKKIMIISMLFSGIVFTVVKPAHRGIPVSEHKAEMPLSAPSRPGVSELKNHFEFLIEKSRSDGNPLERQTLSTGDGKPSVSSLENNNTFQRSPLVTSERPNSSISSRPTLFEESGLDQIGDPFDSNVVSTNAKQSNPMPANQPKSTFFQKLGKKLTNIKEFFTGNKDLSKGDFKYSLKDRIEIGSNQALEGVKTGLTNVGQRVSGLKERFSRKKDKSTSVGFQSEEFKNPVYDGNAAFDENGALNKSQEGLKNVPQENLSLDNKSLLNVTVDSEGLSTNSFGEATPLQDSSLSKPGFFKRVGNNLKNLFSKKEKNTSEGLQIVDMNNETNETRL